MIAVLIDSSKCGASCKVAVRDCTRLRVSGLDGEDVVRVTTFIGDETIQHLCQEDKEFYVAGAQFVRAEHLKTGAGKVSVDLLR
jgi:hypothetical protein